MDFFLGYIFNLFKFICIFLKKSSEGKFSELENSLLFSPFPSINHTKD